MTPLDPLRVISGLRTLEQAELALIIADYDVVNGGVYSDQGVKLIWLYRHDVAFTWRRKRRAIDYAEIPAFLEEHS